MQAMQIADLHSQKDVVKNQARIRRVAVLLGILALIAAAGIAASLIWRDATHMNNPNEMPSQIAAIAITIVFGGAIIFIWSMKLSPPLAYRKFLRELGRGLSRYVEGEIVAVDEEVTFRDGLDFYAIMVNIGDVNDPEDDRRLYWDAQLGKPEALQIGDQVIMHAHGNDILGFEKKAITQ